MDSTTHTHAPQPATDATDGSSKELSSGQIAADRSHRGRDRLVQLVSVLVTLGIWQLIATFWVSPVVLPSPSRIVGSFIDYIDNGSAGIDLSYSGSELLIGYVLGVATGLLVGLAIGWFTWLDKALSAQMTFFYSVPIVALAPLMVVWLGIGLSSKWAVVFLLTFFPVAINTRAGVVSTDTHLLRVARSFGASKSSQLCGVVLPGAVPFILNGMRLGVAYGIIGVFVGELVAAEHGLGYMMQTASAGLQTPRVFVGLLIFGLTGVILTALLKCAEQHFERWRPHRD